MELELPAFRRQLLDEIHLARQAGAGPYLHLLYTPELHDPLDLTGDTRRLSAIIYPPMRLQAAAVRREKAPRLITLDCSRVAPYLLETDPALDDPAFEASITQSHAEICSGQIRDKLVQNDEDVLSEFSVAGWFVSKEDAATLALRLNSFSIQRRSWVPWTHAACVHALWPTMNDAQRGALLGASTWLALNLQGRLCRYVAPVEQVVGDAGSFSRTQWSGGADNAAFDARQVRIARNVQLVNDLMLSFYSMCQSEGRPLPGNTEQLLHAHVLAAQDHGLDADSVAMYVMTIVQLKKGADDDAEWKTTMRGAADQGFALRDRLALLSDRFWERYVPHDIQRDIQIA